MASGGDGESSEVFIVNTAPQLESPGSICPPPSVLLKGSWDEVRVIYKVTKLNSILIVTIKILKFVLTISPMNPQVIISRTRGGSDVGTLARYRARWRRTRRGP